VRVIAIDGPAGSGKSTVARRLAERLELRYLDTGAMYRAVAFAALRRDVDPGDVDAVAKLTSGLDIEVTLEAVRVDGVDATIEIRGPEVTRAVSIVASNSSVREEMRSRQRTWAKTNDGGVIEGRDIGTVVFPDAEVKFFLTASAEVRASRRHAELVAKGQTVTLEETLADVKRRDAQDEGRAVAPLKKADGAVLVDSTTLTFEETVARMLEHVRLVAPS
jgi:cytidylate kinase